MLLMVRLLKIYILFELRVKSEVKTANKRDES